MRKSDGLMLVIDNADDWGIFSQGSYLWLLPRRRHSWHVLITSRCSIIPDGMRKRLTSCYAVPCLASAAAREMLMSFSGRISGTSHQLEDVVAGSEKQVSSAEDLSFTPIDSHDSRTCDGDQDADFEMEAAAWLAGEGCLQGHPLAIGMLAAYIRNTGCSFSDCVKLFQMPLANKSATPADESLLFFVQTTLQACIDKLSQAARELLFLSAFFAPDFVPCRVLHPGQAVVRFPPALRAALFSAGKPILESDDGEGERANMERHWNSLVCELCRFSLASWASEIRHPCSNIHHFGIRAIGVHRLVQNAALNIVISEGLAETMLTAVFELLLLNNSNSDYTFSSLYILPHMVAVDNVATALYKRLVQPASTFSLIATAGNLQPDEFPDVWTKTGTRTDPRLCILSCKASFLPTESLPRYSREVHFNWAVLAFQTASMLRGIFTIETGERLAGFYLKAVQAIDMALHASLNAGQGVSYECSFLWKARETSLNNAKRTADESLSQFVKVVDFILALSLEQKHVVLFIFGHVLLWKALEEWRSFEKYNSVYSVDHHMWIEFNFVLRSGFEIVQFANFLKHVSKLKYFIYGFMHIKLVGLGKHNGEAAAFLSNLSRYILGEVRLAARSFVRLAHLPHEHWTYLLEDEKHVPTFEDVLKLLLAAKNFLMPVLLKQVKLLLVGLAIEKLNAGNVRESLIDLSRYFTIFSATYHRQSQWFAQKYHALVLFSLGYEDRAALVLYSECSLD